MSRELPKSIQDALARQTAGEVHPSPDVLTAFAEHNLPGRENQRITDHLARCANCREVVFLASSAIEEPASAEQEWMPADAIARISPALRAQPRAPAATAGAGPASEKPRRWRVWRWAWAPTVAVVLIVSGVLFEKRSELMGGAPLTTASKGLSLAATAPPATPALAPVPELEPQSALGIGATLETKKPVAKVVRPQVNPAIASDTLAAAGTGRNAAEEYARLPNGIIAPSVGGSSAKSLAAGAPAAPPPQNAFVESETQGASTSAFLAKPYVPSAAPPVTVRGFAPTHPQWHITPDGHLERWGVSGAWTRVLNEQPTTFHVVSVVDNNVWAGGSGGALFHSSDGGQSWNKQPVGSPAVETDTIVAIRFSDALHGVITTQVGVRWSTSDGGVTWTKE